MIKLLKPKIGIYDCPDAIVFKDSSKRQKVYDQLKKKVLQESTVSMFTSKTLLKEGRQYSKNCFYVPNGVDIQGFIQTRHRVPKEMRNLPGPVLGVVGTFDERIDVDLIAYILQNIQEATLVLVGPVHTTMGKLSKNPRVLLVGKRQYEQIPAFIKEFDVALIPYRVNEITKAVYPVKLHEYLVFSKPVVATDLPELKQFCDIIWIGNTKDEFVQCIRVALQEKDEEIRQRRVKVAKENSWERRMSQITEILQNYL
jgi:glycosyltransferase involved in cell wall biosynthesis